MAPLASALALAWLLAAPPALAAPAAEAPPAPLDPDDRLGGYTLDEVWSGQWRRMYDRHGRIDPDGPPQQRLNRRLYPEYEMDVAASDLPRSDEARWRRAAHGGRFRLQSLDEFGFAHLVQLKTRAAVGEAGGYVGLRFDRRYGRGYDSDLMRVDFGHESIAGSPIFARLGVYPRGEKEDIDLELAVGARWADWGEARVRIAAFDAFVDASYALAEGRGLVLDRHLDMQDAPLALALELLSARVAGLRVEVYGARVLPQAIRVWHPEAPEDDHHRRRDDWLGAALIEYRLPWAPVALGLSARRWTSDFGLAGYADPTRDRAVREDMSRYEGYALAAWGDLQVEAVVSRTAAEGLLDPTDFETRDDPQIGGEVRRLSRLRAIYMFVDGFGLELGLMRSHRALTGPEAGRFAGTDHRLLTRFVVPFGRRVWVSFGTGWDLDDGDGVYDGSGVTLILSP